MAKNTQPIAKRCKALGISPAVMGYAKTVSYTHLDVYKRQEQIIFPEIEFEKVDAVRGMDVCFVTTAKTDAEGKELLKALGAPFAENN